MIRLTVEFRPVMVVETDIVIARTQLISRVSFMNIFYWGFRPCVMILQLLLLSGQVCMPRWHDVIMMKNMSMIVVVI